LVIPRHVCKMPNILDIALNPMCPIKNRRKEIKIKSSLLLIGDEFFYVLVLIPVEFLEGPICIDLVPF